MRASSRLVFSSSWIRAGTDGTGECAFISSSAGLLLVGRHDLLLEAFAPESDAFFELLIISDVDILLLIRFSFPGV